MPSKLQALGRYAAIALGASIPISTALDALLFVLVLFAWLFGGALREKLAAVRDNPAALASLALLGLLIAGMTWGPGSVREGWYYVSKYLDLLLIAVLAGFFFSAPEKRLAIAVFLGAMALSLALSYGIWLGLVPIEDGPERARHNPTAFKLHITHGIFMSLAAFLAAVQALRENRARWRALYWAGALLAAFNVLFMVHGRTGHLVLGVLVLYFCAVHWRWRGVVGAVLAGAVVLAAAYFAQAPLVGRNVTAASEWRQWTEGRGYETPTGLRMNYYKTTAAIIRDAPLLGVGTGGFVGAYNEKIRGTSLPESNNPHNQYLLTTAQLGVVGLAALLALFALLWRQAGRLEPAATIAARGLVLSIAVGCVFNSLLIDHAEGLLFAWMAGVLFAPTRRTP